MHEAHAYFEHLILQHDVFDGGDMPTDSLLARVLDEKAERAVDRAYRLLSLLHPWRDIAAARWSIEQGDGTARARAFEYLDNILATRLRQAVLPMLEDLPPEEKIRRGHQICRIHPRGREDSLLALINDADEIVAAAAIELVGSHDLSNLTADVEHVLSHRNVSDQVVFEAASWTLARHRLGQKGRRARWVESLPSIVVADQLRHLAIFGSVTVAEICRLVAGGRQMRHEDGGVLLREGVHPTTFHVLLDGRISAARRATSARVQDAPALLGFEPVLEQRPAHETVRADGPVVTVAVSRNDLLTVLAGNTDLVQGLFRTIAEATSGTKTPPVISGIGTDDLTGLAAEELTLIQKVVVLRQLPIFASVAAEELSQIAAVAQDVSLSPGAILSDATDPPTMCVVLEGSLSLRDPDTQEERHQAGVGDAGGSLRDARRNEAGCGRARSAAPRGEVRCVCAPNQSGRSVRRDRSAATVAAATLRRALRHPGS